MAAPVANVRVSLASWEALKCSGQLVGSNKGILNGLKGAQLERIQDQFLNHDGDELPGVRTVARELDEPVEEGVLHCIRAALVQEISG